MPKSTPSERSKTFDIFSFNVLHSPEVESAVAMKTKIKIMTRAAISAANLLSE
jgi:hypothetical protein